MIGRTNAVSGGAGFGHTVDFISEGAQYAKYMVTDGLTVAAPSPDPTKTDLHFAGWHDSEGATIVFPYTPSGDITFTAEFVLVRDGMVLTEANKTICTLSGIKFYKANAGWAIAGYGYIGGSSCPVLVALSAVEAAITSVWGSTGTGGSFVYRGVTYYYPGKNNTATGNQTSTNTDVTELYKCTESTMEAAALTLVKRYLYEI
jgi:uncharacterized repeat protein (TIGR02543 family)